MFSPLDIVIKPSGYFRYFYYSCLVVASCAVLYSDLSLIIGSLVCAVLLALCCIRLDNPKVIRMFWDLDKPSMRLLCLDSGWQDGIRIEKIHLLPYLYFFKITIKSGKSISICIFPDSVLSEERRRLKLALQLGKMSFEPKAIRN